MDFPFLSHAPRPPSNNRQIRTCHKPASFQVLSVIPFWSCQVLTLSHQIKWLRLNELSKSILN